jgi:hypothetical protein
MYLVSYKVIISNILQWCIFDKYKIHIFTFFRIRDNGDFPLKCILYISYLNLSCKKNVVTDMHTICTNDIHVFSVSVILS